MAPGTYRIFRRELSGNDRHSVIKYFKFQQNILRSLAFLPLVLFVLSTFILSGAGLIMAFSILFSVVAVILAIVVLGMSYSIFQFRKKMSEVLRDGMAVEILGPAARAKATKNLLSFTIGPITLTAQPEALGMVQEGAMVSVLCVPNLNVALSVNNVALAKAAYAKCPSNLDAVAGTPAAQPPFAPPQFGNAPPAPQMQPAQFQPPYYPPPAPPGP
jgi:hypothetical protein